MEAEGAATLTAIGSRDFLATKIVPLLSESLANALIGVCRAMLVSCAREMSSADGCSSGHGVARGWGSMTSVTSVLLGSQAFSPSSQAWHDAHCAWSSPWTLMRQCICWADDNGGVFPVRASRTCHPPPTRVVRFL